MASIAQRDHSWQTIEISRQWSGSDVSKSQALQRKGFNNTKKVGESMPFAIGYAQRPFDFSVYKLEERVGALVNKRG
jgi:hypothetical protein